jgi:hypothetical protein
MLLVEVLAHSESLLAQELQGNSGSFSLKLTPFLFALQTSAVDFSRPCKFQGGMCSQPNGPISI